MFSSFYTNYESARHAATQGSACGDPMFPHMLLRMFIDFCLSPFTSYRVRYRQYISQPRQFTPKRGFPGPYLARGVEPSVYEQSVYNTNKDLV